MAANRLLAAMVRKGGGQLLEAAIAKALPEERVAANADAAKTPKKSLLGGVASVVVMRVATRSVPGAIVVGGAVLAKTLYDRRHAKRAVRRGATGKDAPNT